MGRLVWLIVLVVAAALANDSSNNNNFNLKPEESEFRQEMLKNLNKTNEMLNRLMRIVYEQVVETRKVAEEQNQLADATQNKLDQLATNVDQRLNQTLERVEEAEKGNEELLKYLNKATSERFNRMEKQIYQVLEKDKEMEEKRQNDREKLDALANFTERHIQFFQIRFPTHCNLARLSNLTVLSNGKIYSFHQTLENWTSANETCSKNGLHLATIRDQNEAQLVAAEAQRIIKGYAWWVSAKNLGRGSEKDFRWRDGTKLELDSPLWWEKADKTEDCVRTYNWTNRKLYSYPCNSDLPFICELPSECY
ncbi:C-type lectin domain family 4 member F-like [Neocloeon triangulifer]|uniref:C-type lectin domain family 4 member F-like n=1 Tax=Neocloeon triangulifer TaxID=2078957 RepID=UPI00286F1B9B|nr:C-type lectin domain family 4 member F-like [Neocloeon triangulifer]